MKHLIISLTFLFILSCTAKQLPWQTLDFGAFRLKTPPGWTIIKERGIDSYVGGLTNGKDSLWFSYSPYGISMGSDEIYAQQYAKDTVNGLIAGILVPDTIGRGYITMYIARVTTSGSFTIWGKDIQDTATILKIYKSAVFESSDTTLNPPLTKEKFVLAAHGDGKQLYRMNCASCHNIVKIMTGPALGSAIKQRSDEWIYTMLTNRGSIKQDSIRIVLSKTFEDHCPKYTDLTQADVYLIADYIRSWGAN